MGEGKELGPLVLQDDAPPDIRELFRQVGEVKKGLATDRDDPRFQFSSTEEEKEYKQELTEKMRALLEMRVNPLDDKDENYFKRANKFTAASGYVQQVLVYFPESLTHKELKEQILERLGNLRKRIAKKKRVVIDESRIDPATKKVEERYRVRPGKPISDGEVQEMKQFLRIGLIVLKSPKDLESQVKSIFEEEDWNSEPESEQP